MAIGTKAQTIPPTKAQTASSPRPSPPKTVRTAVWRWLKRTGLERCELVRDTAGWTMRGTIVTLGERGPAEASYTISCDPEWRTERADISLRDDSGARALGLVDIDLGWSPSTNTIAIRRLNLRVGARSGPLTMAWVRFPDLRVGPLAQEYERLEERRYRYTSRGGAFSAVIEVDDDGLVVEYEGFWQRARETR